jgi:hypothetical protein
VDDLTFTSAVEPSGSGDVSLDRAEAHGAVKLIQAALQAAAEVQLPAETVPLETEEGPINPRTMVTVIIYAMARGIFDLEELEARLRSDPDLRYVCAHRFPDSHALRSFRRHHWNVLEWALAGLIRRSVADSCVEPLAAEGPEVEARRRLELSAWTDTVK